RSCTELCCQIVAARGGGGVSTAACARAHSRSTTNRLEACHASLSHDAHGCWQTSTKLRSGCQARDLVPGACGAYPREPFCRRLSTVPAAQRSASMPVKT